MKKTNYYKLSVEAVLSNSLRRFRRMLKKARPTEPSGQALYLPESRNGFNEEEWFFSNVEAARFFGCSVRTVQRLRKCGLILCIQHGNVCLFHIATVLRSIANDDRLSALFIRAPRPRRPKKAPAARYSCFLRKGWLWICVRFLGKDSTIIVRQKQWNSDERIAELVKDVISYRLSAKTFKSSGHEKN
jgi:hypothetical protein